MPSSWHTKTEVLVFWVQRQWKPTVIREHNHKTQNSVYKH